MQFDGKDDFVQINSENLKKIGEQDYGTISLWFKFEDIGSGKILPIFYFGETDDSGPSSNLVIEIGHFGHGFPSDTKLYYTVYNNTEEPVLCFDSGQNLQKNTWYHFALVNTPTGNTGYLNGEELTNRHYNFSSSTATQFFSSLPRKEVLYLGYGWFGIDQKFHFFKGAIDEVKIYNQALSSDKIQDLANL